jgi:hypothetical protein
MVGDRYERTLQLHYYHIPGLSGQSYTRGCKKTTRNDLFRFIFSNVFISLHSSYYHLLAAVGLFVPIHTMTKNHYLTVMDPSSERAPLFGKRCRLPVFIYISGILTWTYPVASFKIT